MWQSLSYADRSIIPPSSGIYRIEANGICLYVGSAFNLYKRLNNHTYKKIFEKHGADKVYWRLVTDAELGLEEIRSIIEFKPLLNKFRKEKPKGISMKKLKTELIQHPMVTRVRELLKARPEYLTFKQIEADTGISVAWLTKFVCTDEIDPAFSRVANLYEYLSGKKIEVA